MSDAMAIRTLRKEFGVGKKQASHYIAIARKRVADAFVVVSLEERRAKLEALLMSTIDDAEVPSQITGQPNAGAKVAAIAKLADVYGVAAKVQLDAKVTGVAELLAQAFDAGPGDSGKE